ncbi:hypothetical protein, partial [Brucella sp. NBRC 113783]|uniref:hypothetical protein n=1 Tax=Brucella sp. NBRC 113783 TaxID=3075478 RepID=UPI00333EFD24
QTVQPVNPFFSRKSQSYQPQLPQIQNQISTQSWPPHLLVSQQPVNHFHQNSRTKQPAASSVAALVVALYRPRTPKLSTQVLRFFDIFLTIVHRVANSGISPLYIYGEAKVPLRKAGPQTSLIGRLASAEFKISPYCTDSCRTDCIVDIGVWPPRH